MRHANSELTIGTVSSGTLRAEDLLDSFLWEAEHLRLTRTERTTVRAIRKAVHTRDDDYATGQEGAEDVDTLTTILDRHTPPYCYFGTLEGDGAEFGVWPAIDSLEEDARTGEVLKVSDLSEVPSCHTGSVMLVTDHGNVTLYRYSRGRGRELWACV